MCVSAATLNLQAARRLEWDDQQLDEEDELPSSRTCLGLPPGCLEDESEGLETSSYPYSVSFPPSCRSSVQRMAAEIEHQLLQLQQVTGLPAGHFVACCSLSASAMFPMINRLRHSSGWAGSILRFNKFRTTSCISCTA